MSQRRVTTNPLGVTSIMSRELGGRQAMMANRATRRVARQQPDSSGESFQVNSFPQPRVSNPRGRPAIQGLGGKPQPGASRGLLQSRRTPKTAPQPPTPSKSQMASINVKTDVDQLKAKLATLVHRIDGLSEQVQELCKENDLSELNQDVDNIINTLNDHTNALTEVREAAAMIKSVEHAARDIHNQGFTFYGRTLCEVPCYEDASFDDEAVGVIAEDEEVLLVNPMEMDEDGNAWVKARRIDDQAQITEYWVPMATVDGDVEQYFGGFHL